MCRFPEARIYGKAWKNPGISGFPASRFSSNGQLVFANHVGNHMGTLRVTRPPGLATRDPASRPRYA